MRELSSHEISGVSGASGWSAAISVDAANDRVHAAPQAVMEYGVGDYATGAAIPLTAAVGTGAYAFATHPAQNCLGRTANAAVYAGIGTSVGVVLSVIYQEFFADSQRGGAVSPT